MRIKLIISLFIFSSIFVYVIFTNGFFNSNVDSNSIKMEFTDKSQRDNSTHGLENTNAPVIKKINDSRSTNRSDNNIQLWKPNDSITKKKFPYKNLDKLNYEYVNFNREAISKFKIKDEFSMFIPQTQRDYIGQISSIVTSDTGNKSYVGSLSDYDDTYQFIITQGPGTTFVNVITPDGKFVLEAIGNNAWIYDNAELVKTLDFSKSDAVIAK